MNSPLPRMFRLRQNFQHPPPLDFHAAVIQELAKVRNRITPGARLAVAVGSRGIANLSTLVSTILEHLRELGARPFIIPAMGSHGGATPEGQLEVLASYGITETAMGVPIHPSLEVREIGISSDGIPVYCSVEALDADGVLVVNRVKPHTDFGGALGSGLLKMCVVGLGKRVGASAMHAAASRIGHEQAIRGIASVVLRSAPILCGVAILENQFHETAKIVVLPREDIEAGEDPLLTEAWALMPRLPFDEIDLLIVDQLGKNISGAGMDPNVIGRGVEGYSASLLRLGRPAPFVRRLFVRDLTPEAHGNAVGIGLADFTTTRLVRAMDPRITYLNSLTALAPQCAKIPIHFDTDREALEQALTSLAMPGSNTARIVHIANTLSLIHLEASEALWQDVCHRADLTPTGELAEMRFTTDGHLLPMSLPEA